MESNPHQKAPIGRLEKALSPSDGLCGGAIKESNVKRPRRKAPKVKTGCITCKWVNLHARIRRVKCDETKPVCEKCTSTGRKCDGYSIHYSDPNPTHDNNAGPERSNGAIAVVPRPIIETPGNSEERRCFDFFINRTASQLAGFWDSDFWECLILRATFHQPAIRHAILALGSLHERFEAGAGSAINPTWDNREGRFALKQYNQAIQQLVKPTTGGQQAVDVCLIACIIFACFETLRGHHGSALSHITSGVKILSEVDFNDIGGHCHGVLTSSPYPFVDLRELEILFNRLDTQASQMIGSRPMLLKKHPREIDKGFCPEIPAAFSSLVQAKNSLDYQWNTQLELLNELESDTGLAIVEGQRPLDALGTIDAARGLMFNVVDRWLVAYRAFLQNHGRPLDGREMQAAHTLEISHSLAMMFLTVSTTYSNNDLTAWDWFTEDFEHIVDLATLILKSSNGDKFTTNRGPEFTLDMSIVAPLFVVASKCRHPIIRRKALALLYAAPRQEGIWDSVLTAHVAERLIGIEEAGLGNVNRCEDVPDWARISEVEVKFDLQERLGTVKYSRQRSKSDKVRDTVVESVRW